MNNKLNIDIEIFKRAAERWNKHSGSRRTKLQHVRSGDIFGAETPERINARLSRVRSNAFKERLRAIDKTSAVIIDRPAPVSATEIIGQFGKERIIGKPDFLNINFLELALAISRTVARINIKSGPVSNEGYGTGFLVSPRLLMTNNHVLSSPQKARFSEAEFDFQHDRNGRVKTVRSFKLAPNDFFMTDYDLDFTIVALSELAVDGQTNLSAFGWNKLIKAEGKALIGDSLNIIQHPEGKEKKIALRSNQLLDLLDEGFAHYETDTEPGSSGSPVYNDDWEVVALHHSGVPKVENGQFISVSGTPWNEGDDPELLAWVANEGIRISRIVSLVERLPLAEHQSNLRREMFETEPPNPLLITMKTETGSPGRPAVAQYGQYGVNSEGAVNLTIPLHITVRLGSPETGAGIQANNQRVEQVDLKPLDNPTPLAGRADPGSSVSAEMRGALRELEESVNRPYYDEVADIEARTSYYRSIDPDALSDDEFYKMLSRLVAETHTTKIGYKPAVHLYPWIDLIESENGLVLRSVYSGKEFEAADFIERDFRIERERVNAREAMLRESFSSISTDERLTDLLEASMPYNCEHVVPQSWFAKKEPMRGDLHHLFACESGCNSFRGNIPYFDFTDFDEVVREACGKREQNKFEPSFGKGAVARATMYFLLRYTGQINRTSGEYTDDRIHTLIKWHRANPVSRYELHRNAAIFEKQGNRNPFIDFPEWAAKVNLNNGLG